jgi:hypothetical protein
MNTNRSGHFLAPGRREECASTLPDHPTMKGKPTMSYYAKSSPAVEARTEALAKAHREKQQIMDTVIEKYIAAARFASLEELTEVSHAVERLHEAHAQEIADKAIADIEALRRRTFRYGPM